MKKRRGEKISLEKEGFERSLEKVIFWFAALAFVSAVFKEYVLYINVREELYIAIFSVFVLGYVMRVKYDIYDRLNALEEEGVE